jgi:DNA-binding response OmpR family regulator
MKKGSVLVVDNEPDLLELLRINLEYAGLQVQLSTSGQEALQLMHRHAYDLIILDVLLDDMNGFEVLRLIRQQHIDTPILLLSAKRETESKIYGFHLGADDYVTKPFNPSELIARVQARLRRSPGSRNMSNSAPSVPLMYGPFTLYKDSQLVYKHQTPISLSEKETELLYALMKRPNQAIAKMELFEQVWGHSRYNENSLNVYINHLRRKIEDDPRLPRYIQTVWGLGYRFTAQAHPATESD